ncbi:hypothetical protein KSB_25460 [Ktedonobacter robiniae]|uniref:Major facilitator superfamily (MFS) profile domain-containing protein n=2 Tax=Ktedonobacter robiniae TaxID=2778365 RepID=A0ABQ3UMU1_9CHLR|nr:hypothetical protein KSB_25460 [Ktedonobacter robiniae]
MASSWLWISIAIAALGNISIDAMDISLPKLVQDTYHAGVWLVGTAGTANALGAIVGSIIIGQRRQLRRRGILAYLSLLLTGGSTMAIGFPWPTVWFPWAACGCSVFIGLGLGTFGVIWVTVLQELVPEEKQGRVFSIDALGSSCLLPIGLSLAGLATDRFGPSWMFLVGGGVLFLLTASGLLVRGVRQLD